MSVSEEEDLTPKEVADKLKVHVYTVYGLLEKGDLRGFKVSNRWRIPIEEYRRFRQLKPIADKRSV